MAAFFVTSCGTGRGKTHVAESLIRDWRAAGRRVEVLKPVISGFDPQDAAGSDTGRLLAAAGEALTPEAIDRVSPWRYAAPLSPDMAAAREGRSVPVDEIVAFCRTAVASAEAVDADLLVEGAGGVMVPLDETRTMRDLMAALEIPAILVVGSYLGSLSHTLTAFEALRARGVTVDRIVVNQTEDSDIPLSEIRDTLRRFVGDVPIATLEFVLG